MTRKCVFVVDATLPIGLIANTAAVLSLSLGKAAPETVGPDLVDQDGRLHRGITTIVMPILRSDPDGLRQLRERADARAQDDLMIFDVTDAAQTTKSYPEYEARLAATPGSALRYLGLCLYGPPVTIKSLTGNLPLLR